MHEQDIRTSCTNKLYEQPDAPRVCAAHRGLQHAECCDSRHVRRRVELDAGPPACAKTHSITRREKWLGKLCPDFSETLRKIRFHSIDDNRIDRFA